MVMIWAFVAFVFGVVAGWCMGWNCGLKDSAEFYRKHKRFIGE